MSSVFFQSVVVRDLPVLLFHYGIVELGDAEPGFEKSIRKMLKEAGMGEHTTLDETISRVSRPMHVVGEDGKMDWWDDESACDEFPELGQEWVDAALDHGAFLAVYRNMLPDGPFVLQDLMRSDGALVGIVPIERGINARDT